MNQICRRRLTIIAVALIASYPAGCGSDDTKQRAATAPAYGSVTGHGYRYVLPDGWAKSIEPTLLVLRITGVRQLSVDTASAGPDGGFGPPALTVVAVPTTPRRTAAQVLQVVRTVIERRFIKEGEAVLRSGHVGTGGGLGLPSETRRLTVAREPAYEFHYSEKAGVGSAAVSRVAVAHHGRPYLLTFVLPGTSADDLDDGPIGDERSVLASWRWRTAS